MANFRDVCCKHYNLDPAHYYTAPGLAWDTALKVTKVNLVLLSDLDMLLMVEKGIKGGVLMLTNRYGKANNKYMGDKYDATKPSKYITYLDANNLYGWAKSKPLPTHTFKWMNEEELENRKKHSCISEINLEYPKELHDLHNDYPLGPERINMSRVEKLVPNLWDKTKYVVHYENLKQYKSCGLKIKKIFVGLSLKKVNGLNLILNLILI